MEAKRTILVVEDEEKIREGLKDFLEFQNFAVTTATDGQQAEALAAAQSFDLILLDLMLPKISGQQLCKTWRQQGLNTPIIMLTAKGAQEDRVAGLEMGADDYITKPFSLEELLARIRAIFRRTDPARSVGQQFQFGPFKVDMASLKLIKDGKEAVMTPRQAQMIQLFAANPNRVISRQELYEAVWRESLQGIETRTVDMHLVRLRELFHQAGADDEVIHTVRGAGYQYIQP